MDLAALTEANRVRVVVLPVGSVTPKRFKYYYQLIASFHTLQLAHMTRNVMDKNRVLKQDWSNGVFRFQFIDFKDWHKSEWEELHNTRKAFAVVGIIDGTVTSDWAAAYKTMADSLKRFPSVLSHICFAFDPGEKPDVDRNPHLIVIPNAEEVRLQFYLQTLLLDFASRLVRTMEEWVFDATEAQATLTTSLDFNQGPDDVPKLKKRKASRLLKNKGDYCLLVSAPADALTYYNEAVAQAKANGDSLWYAAGLEGQAAATLLCALQETDNRQVTSVPALQLEYVTETLHEALQAYARKKAAALEVEAWVKVGRLYAALGKRDEANEAWMSAQHVAASLTKQLKIQLDMELTALYTELGMRRKAAFFLRETALLHAKIFNHALSHRLLALASPSFLLFPDALPSQALASVAQRERAARVKQEEVPVGWGVLQKYLLKDLIDAAKSANDPNTTAGYITFLLRNYRDLLSHKYQIKLANTLSAVTDDLPVSLQMTMLGLPLLVSITPEPLPPALCAHPTAVQATERSIFITSPFDRQREKKVELVWVENEVAEAQVLLSNPMAFPITIESMALSTSGVAFEAYSVSLVVPPHTQRMSVLLSGKPLGSGTLFIKGCTIRTFNLLCEHPIGPTGKAISLTEASRLKYESATAVAQANAVRIVPSLPRLLVRDQSAAAGNVSLWTGQQTSAEYEVENIGGQPISYMDLTVQANYQQSLRDPPPSTFVWDKDRIKSALPLAPGARFTFTASFTAKPLTVGHTLTITYGNEKHADYSRRVEVSCPVNLLQGLGVGRIDTIEWAGTAIPFADIPSLPPPCVLLSFEVVNSGPTVFALECQVSDDTDKQGRVAATDESAAKPRPAEVSEPVWGPAPAVEAFDADLAQRVQALESASSTSVAPSSQLPVIVGDESRTSPSRVPSRTPIESGVFFTSRTITIAPHSSKRVLLPMRKFNLPPPELVPNVPAHKQRRVPDTDRYLAELSKRVVMRWKSLTSNSDGLLSFLTSNVFFPESCISLLSAPPINVLLRVRGKPDAAAVTTAVFEFHEIEVVVYNSSPKARQLSLSLLSYQDFNNGVIESNLAGKVAIAGAPQAQLPVLEAGRWASHTLVVSFLAAGRFKFSASCRDEDGLLYATPAPLCIIASA